MSAGRSGAEPAEEEPEEDEWEEPGPDEYWMGSVPYDHDFRPGSRHSDR